MQRGIAGIRGERHCRFLLCLMARFRKIENVAQKPMQVLRCYDFICQLGYRDFEIKLRTHANRVEIERIWIELWDSADDKPIPKPARIRLAPHTKVDLGKFRPGLPLSKAEAALDVLKLPYEVSDTKNGSEVVKRIILPTNSELYFFSGVPEPVLMEIHFFAKTD